MNYVYILRCRDGTYYTGWTSDLERRLEMHNRGKASKYTRSRLPVELVYYEVFQSKSKAMKRECSIKGMSRTDKSRLIKDSIEKKLGDGNCGIHNTLG